MRSIQTKTLPQDWLQQLNTFDVKTSNLSRNNQVIANRLLEFIKEEGSDSLLNPLCKLLILHVVFKKSFLAGYDNVPVELIQEGIDEIKGERGFYFTRKVHSLFVEFLIYIKLNSYGYVLKTTDRPSGSCDLVMAKDNINYNFEVKFKESNDTFKSRLFDIIDGMSLLKENLFLRGKRYEIFVKPNNINYKIQEEILIDIKDFLVNKKDIHQGKHVDIFEAHKRQKVTRDIDQVNAYVNSLHISQELTDEDTVFKLIQKMFFEKDGHITKLVKKSKSIENFNGCLVWDIPFHNDIDLENIRSAFNRLKLGFNLYVFIGGIAKTENDFLVKKYSM